VLHTSGLLSIWCVLAAGQYYPRRAFIIVDYPSPSSLLPSPSSSSLYKRLYDCRARTYRDLSLNLFKTHVLRSKMIHDRTVQGLLALVGRERLVRLTAHLAVNRFAINPLAISPPSHHQSTRPSAHLAIDSPGHQLT